MDLVGLALLIGATAYRVWRLIAVDSITSTPRLKLIKPGSWLDTLVSCPWCLGSWIAFGITAWVALAYDLPYPWLAAGGAAVTTGILGTILPD